MLNSSHSISGGCMKVWIIYESWIDDTYTMGVFGSHEKAEEFLKLLQEAHTGYYMREYEVDKPVKVVHQERMVD